MLKILFEKAFRNFKAGDSVPILELFPMFSKPEPEVTDDYIRIRIKDPELFLDETFRWVTLSEEKGIHSIQGKLKEDGEDGPMTVQSYVFEKEKWTLEGAQSWVDDHKKSLKISPLSADESRRMAEKCIKGTPEQFEVKQVGSHDLYIEGYASTNALDRGGDVVDPHAFDETMEVFMKNPICLYMHGWWDLPIGKVVDHRIDEKGLWVKVYVSETAWEIRTLVTEGILKAFSIGYDPTLMERINPGTPHEYRLIKKLTLYEISVVNIPMNADALMELAKAKGLKIENLKSPVSRKEPGQEEEKNMDPELVKKMIAETLAANNEVLFAKMKEPGVAEKTLADLSAAVKNIPNEGEFKAFVEKHTAEAKAAVDALQKKIEQEWLRPSRMEFADAATIAQAKRMGFLDGLRDEKNLPSADGFKALMLSEVPEKTATHIGMLDRLALVKEFQETSDALLFVAAYKGYTVVDPDGAGVLWVKNPVTLKTYQKYRRLAAEFCKAMDTETTAEGTEWLPTYMSGTLITGLEAERGVIRRIPRVAMPSKSWDWPLRSTKPVPYKKSEAISDSNINTIILSTMATGKITFTAKGLGIGSVISSEEIEDSIIAILPTLQADFKLAINAGEENAVINGDDGTTHQDTDVAAEGVGSANITRLFDGLRYMALNGTSATVSGSGGSISHALLVSLMKTAGKYAIAPQKGFFILSYPLWFKMLTLTEYKDQAVFGLLAANLTGALPRVLGCDVVPSEYMRFDLNSSGVNGASGNTLTGALYVHPDYFKIGDRRIYTVESDKRIMSDNVIVVGTERIDFKKMAPALDNPVTFLYNVLTT